MRHLLSEDDLILKRDIESLEFPVSAFDHRTHLRLAYVYLTENGPDIALKRMRTALNSLLLHIDIEPSTKYHETLTAAWILAVYHFMNKAQFCDSSDDLISQYPIMLDSKIMMTHYSTEVLFSEKARRVFIEPNLDPIPRYANC